MFKKEWMIDMMEQKTILIVDDENMMREAVASYLEKQGYHVLQAETGTQALSLLEKETVSFVILDLMLPDISGEEICSRIRRQSRIPIIMLTAKTMEDDMLNGLNLGADDYITKPFSVGILKATIKNLLANRALLRQVYNSIEEEEQSFPVNCTNTLDWKFIASVKECIEKNMGDPDFNVEMLSSRHHMSRTSFFNKLKVLTGYAPADYIRMIRLQHAAQLLKQGEHTVTEVADIVGFSDVKYFREVFKKYYDVSPSKYAESGKDVVSSTTNSANIE